MIVLHEGTARPASSGRASGGHPQGAPPPARGVHERRGRRLPHRGFCGPFVGMWAIKESASNTPNFRINTKLGQGVHQEKGGVSNIVRSFFGFLEPRSKPFGGFFAPTPPPHLPNFLTHPCEWVSGWVTGGTRHSFRSHRNCSAPAFQRDSRERKPKCGLSRRRMTVGGSGAVPSTFPPPHLHPPLLIGASSAHSPPEPFDRFYPRDHF